MTHPGNRADGSALCLSCGMCCDGTLFTHVAFEPGDAAIEPVFARMTAVAEGSGRGFAQPCEMLDRRACAIYARRPRPCARFRCRTLRELDRGWIDVDDAASRVDAALSARAEVMTADGTGAPLSELRTRMEQAVGAERRDPAMIALARLELVLLRWFRDPPEKPLDH